MAKSQNYSMIITFQVKGISIGISIGDTSPVLTWYQIYTQIPSMAHLYSADPLEL